MRNPTRFLTVFGLFWSAITLSFDVIIVRGVLGQWRSMHFIAAEGHILHSEVTTSNGSEGATYGARVRYEYRVNDRRYESDRVRYGQMSTSDGKWARRTVRENPAGATRPVYYDSAAPAEAVLQTGVNGENLFMALFISPFNAVMIGLWCWAVAARRPDPPYGGARIRAVAGGVRRSLRSD